MPRARTQVYDMRPSEAMVQAAIRRVRRGDSCTHDGAARLKEKIEAFWLARGRAISVTIVKRCALWGVESIYGLESSSLNGWPGGAA